MRPIKIDKELQDFAKDFAENLFKEKQNGFKKPLENLNGLLKKYPKRSFPVEFRILNWIIDAYNNSLLYYNPTQLQRLVNITDRRYSLKFYKDKKQTQFSRDIVDALRYDELQSSEAYKIADKLKIKVCPYCNAMITITIIKDKSQKKARFQLDHFFPKSKYPFLCTSFFNLIPCCSNCNQSKSNNAVSLIENFHLYSDETPNNAFKFKLNDASLIKKMIGFNQNDIKITFTFNDEKHKKFVETHDEMFSINSLYCTQIDIVEELIWKAQSYDNNKIADLQSLLKIDESSIKRMLIGNYIDYEDIHKRPMAKFMQDIARDLDLIK